MKHVTIELSEPIIGHSDPIRRVVLQEPRARDYFALGEPSVYARNPDGTVYAVENAEVIDRYIERCIVEPKESILLDQMSLGDAMRVKDAVLGFFSDARKKTLPSSSMSSSSD